MKQKKFNASENVEIKKLEIQEKPEITKKNMPDVALEKQLFVVPKKEKKIKEKTIIKNIEEQKLEPLKKIEILNTPKIKPKLKPKPKKNYSNSINTDVEINSKPQPKLNINNTDVEINSKPQPKLNINNTDVEINPKPQSKPKPDMSLASIYKDLRNEKSNQVIDETFKEKKDEKKEINITNENEKESMNSELSITELDLVLQQLRSCFNPQAGTIIEKDEMVVISAQIDRNARVKTGTIQISDTNIDKNNPYYKSITESAMRTLYNPACSILKLPKEKYDTWKKLTIKFDYSWITK